MNSWNSPLVTSRSAVKRPHERLVRRPLVVEHETGPVASQREDAALELDADGRGWADALWTGFERSARISRSHGVVREDVLDVGDEKLLMLLLVIEAEAQRLLEPVAGTALDERPHRLIDGLAVGEGLP